MKAAAAALRPELLASMELFVGLPPAALADVMAAAWVRRVAKGGRIFDQGAKADRAYALVEGRVRITQSGSDGGQVVIRFIGPGEMFGTAALFTDRHYPAEAVALCDSLGMSWSEADLLHLIDQHPPIAINLVKIIGHRLQEVQERVRELATQSAERRVAHALLRLANQAGEGTVGGTRIDFPLTRKHIAEIAGTTLYTASRILTAWEKLGWIATHRQRVTLRNPGEIERIAEQ